jgi:uncharacterized protein (DUF2336 family)
MTSEVSPKDLAAQMSLQFKTAKKVESTSFLDALEEAVARGTPESRARALWHTTDLMIAGSFSDDEIWTFGEVVTRLADEIEVAARAQLSERLARFDNAPVNIIHKLAFDDAIEVAGPVLRESTQLETYALVANACTKSQAHMLSISKRDTLEERLTDELVRRGNHDVVKSVAGNAGAKFSDFGFLNMVKRAEGDSILAEQLGLRKDIPRHVFQQLIAKATADVKKKLEHERPDMAQEIRSSVTGLAGELQSKFGPASRGHLVAKRVVSTQHRLGNLNEASISGYARSHRFEEVTIGMSLMCALPGDLIERTLLDKNREMLLILSKALDFSWDTTMALLFLGAKDHRITANDLRTLESDYGRLNIETSRSVLAFCQSRKTGTAADAGLKAALYA